jgi:DNA-binding NarL/FixJ family response regulator
VRDTKEKIRVLVADDHAVVREGLCSLLSEEADLEVVAKAADGKEAIELAKELHPDVAIIDIVMPELDGIETAKQIKAACPAVAIVMLSAYDYEAYTLGALEAGAVGYLLKETSPYELVNAIRMIHAGRGVVDLKVWNRMLQRLTAPKDKGKRSLGKLQTRELDILKLVAKGMNSREIGKNLFISERTVHTHLDNIFTKLGVHSRTEAVVHALREGWLTLDGLRQMETSVQSTGSSPSGQNA